jgi:hypothetical protein
LAEVVELALEVENPAGAISKRSKLFKWVQCYLGVSWTTMHRANLWRSIFSTPFRLGQVVVLLLIVLEQVRNRTQRLLQLPRCVEQVHHVVLVTDLVW